VADLAGVSLVSFLVFWCGEGLYRAVVEGTRGRALGAPLLALLLALGYGTIRAGEFKEPHGPPQPVALIQANLTIREKGNIKFFQTNLQRYVELTEKIVRPGLLVIWPESIFIDFIAATIGSVKNDPRLPFWDKGVSLLIGALTFTSRTEYHNSALAILPDGSIPPPYHKQILMPFGEYTPLASVFPWIKELNATAGDFTAGRDLSIFRFPGANGDFGVAPLICYEDIVPPLSRAATQRGAHLLVNMTNDAWFGDTAAPHQHHLIAAWRAIENRRYLIRSTNSGLTAIVNPRGETPVTLPTFSEGILESVVVPLDIQTVYTSTVGEYPWWILTIVSLLAVARNLGRRRGRAV
jgi:apolipoprotein N-acyltransferase